MRWGMVCSGEKMNKPDCVNMSIIWIMSNVNANIWRYSIKWNQYLERKIFWVLWILPLTCPQKAESPPELNLCFSRCLHNYPAPTIQLGSFPTKLPNMITGKNHLQDHSTVDERQVLQQKVREVFKLSGEPPRSMRRASGATSRLDGNHVSIVLHIYKGRFAFRVGEDCSWGERLHPIKRPFTI